MASRIARPSAWIFPGCLILLVGCADMGGLRPSVPTFKSTATLGESRTPIDSLKELLHDYRTKIAAAVPGKHGQEWSLKEGALFGGLTATAGYLASKTALLNSGSGIGTIALGIHAFYRPGETMQKHLNALEEFTCMSRVVVPLSDDRLTTALGVPDEAKKIEVAQAPSVLAEAIDDAVIRHMRAVLSQETGKTDPADQRRFYEKLLNDLKEQTDTELRAQKIQKDGRNASEAAATLAAVPFLGLKTRLEACHKGIGSR